MDHALRSELLKLYPVLNQVPAEQLDAALADAYVKRVNSGTFMWDETYRVQTFPFLLKGNVRIVKLAPNGRELHLYTVAPGGGCVVAVASLVGNSAVNARAFSEGDIEMILISMAGFKSLIATSEPFRDYVFSDLTEQMAQLTELVTAIAFQKLDQRLAASLVAKGNMIQTTHQALADELGSVREIVSRLLKNFASEGWIALQRGQIHVLNAGALKEFSVQT